MVGDRAREILDRSLRPLVGWIARTGISPSVITIASPIVSALICLWFVRTRAVLPFCAAILAAGCLDLLDGMVARASGRVTQFGGYLDAVCDRYAEAVVVLSVAYVTGYWLLSTAVLTGAQLVSYAKARAAMEVPVSNREWPDLMERMERDVLFVAGLAASVLLPWRPLGRDLFWWTLVALTVLIHATVVQRVLRARRFIRERAAKGRA